MLCYAAVLWYAGNSSFETVLLYYYLSGSIIIIWCDVYYLISGRRSSSAYPQGRLLIYLWWVDLYNTIQYINTSFYISYYYYYYRYMYILYSFSFRAWFCAIFSLLLLCYMVAPIGYTNCKTWWLWLIATAAGAGPSTAAALHCGERWGIDV
jgi:hypothetical protein